MALCLLPLFFLQTLILAQPQPEDTLLFREGEVLLSKGEVEKALWRFKSVITDHPKSPLIHEAKFRMGICYTQLKRSKDAIRILKELFSTFLSPSRMVQVFSLLGENYLELKDRFSALHWYGKALLVSGEPKEELKKKVRAIIDTFSTEDDLKQIESLYRGAYGGGYAKMKLAKMARRSGDDFLAKKMTEELKKEYPNADYLSQILDLPELPSPALEPFKYTVGVILPLSGVYEPFGKRVLQGIQLAINEIYPQDKDPLITFIIKDSKGSPLEAEQAFEELVSRERAIAIIGPLLSINVDRIVRKAQQLKVPVLSLSQKEFLVDKGDFLFQNLLTPSNQIQTLVAYAMNTLELKTFGIFYPNSPYGIHFKNLFIQEVSRRGGKVLGAVAYLEDQTDFRNEIKWFFKIEGVTDSESPRKRWGEEFEAGLSVDGFFIPDTHDRVGLIISQIAYYDVKELTFLGTNAWNGPDLIPIAGKSAEGAVFVDVFCKKNPSFSTVRFVEEFQKTYQRDPETLEALSYDGAKFLVEVLRSKRISSPFQLSEEMFRFRTFQGVSGLKGFGDRGNPIRTFFILRVENGQIGLVAP